MARDGGQGGILKTIVRRPGGFTIPFDVLLKWTRDQKHLFFSFGAGGPDNADGMDATYVIPLTSGRALPAFPPDGVESDAQLRTLPNVRVINRVGLFPGPTSSVYAFQRRLVQRNLYRLTLPR